MKWLSHLRTVQHHRFLVLRHCWRVGLYWQGLTHDLSKFSPVEFSAGAKYYQGNRSPNEIERREKGYSAAWLHLRCISWGKEENKLATGNQKGTGIGHLLSRILITLVLIGVLCGCFCGIAFAFLPRLHPGCCCGYAPDEVAYPVYVLKELGVKALVVTNASGGINTGYHAGDFMLITDHINMTGKSPLTGKNDPALGTRFPDMTFAYSHKLGEKAMQAAADCGLKLHQGVYCGVNGPQFETPAEIRMFRTLGADAVGMSTVFEVIAAAHCGLPLVGIAMITNMAAGVLMQPLSGAEVNETAERRGAELRRLVAKLLEKI